MLPMTKQLLDKIEERLKYDSMHSQDCKSADHWILYGPVLLARVKRLEGVLVKTLGALHPYDKDGNVSPIVELVNEVLDES